MSPSTSARDAAGRYVFPDALRGVAALMVVFYHLHENIAPSLDWLPKQVSEIFLFCRHGVDIFFVLSGFVIAHSVIGGERSARYLYRYGFRRSIRLDPPLWAVIAAELMLLRVSSMLFPSIGNTEVTLGQFFANITYTQHFLGYKDIVPVFWSLTYEVQFYIFYVGSVALFSHRMVAPVKALCVCFLYLMSVSIWGGLIDNPVDGLFLDRWFQFCLGVSAYRMYNDREIFWQLPLLGSAGIILVFAGSHGDYRVTVYLISLVTAAALSSARFQSHIMSFAQHQYVQFFGTISYSLYLIHLSIGWRVISAMKIWFGPKLAFIEGIVVFILAVASSVVAAYFLYIVFERPSVSLAKKVRLPSARGQLT